MVSLQNKFSVAYCLFVTDSGFEILMRTVILVHSTSYSLKCLGENNLVYICFVFYLCTLVIETLVLLKVLLMAFQDESMRTGSSDDPRLQEPMKVVHKEQDIITSFAVNQVTSQCFISLSVPHFLCVCISLCLYISGVAQWLLL